MKIEVHSWLHKIRNFNRLYTAHRNLQEDNRRQCDSNSKKALRIATLEAALAKEKLKSKTLECEILTIKFDAIKEPARNGSCEKPRIDGLRAAKDIALDCSIQMKKSLGIYHCRICPPSPLTKQRYYHLTSKTHYSDNVFIAEYKAEE